MRKIIIGSGHGEDTPGKRSIFHEMFYKGKWVARFKENNFTEAIANKFSFGYDNSFFITNEWYDVSLKERMKREHEEATNDSIFISIHADAWKVKDGAKGGTFFYYSESGKKIAAYLTKYMKSKGHEMRSAKQANFYVLKNSKSKAVLCEAKFYTTTSDLVDLENETYRNKFAKDLISAFKEMPADL